MRKRSGGKCENRRKGDYNYLVRCQRPATDVHHLLPRSRGGHLLDPWDTYHLMHLCRECHMDADKGLDSYQEGLLIHGSVITGTDGYPVYTGPDEYLTHMFNKERGTL